MFSLENFSFILFSKDFIKSAFTISPHWKIENRKNFALPFHGMIFCGSASAVKLYSISIFKFSSDAHFPKRSVELSRNISF